MSGIEVATGQLTEDFPKNASPLRSECSDLLSCAEWHEKEAWSHREDCEYRGGPETELGAEALEMTEKHAKFANAIRAALGAR